MVILPKNMPLSTTQEVTVLILNQKYKVHIRGWCAGEYIITEAPTFRTTPVHLAPGTGCEVYFVKGGVYYNFKANVICISLNIIPLLILEFPKNVDSYSLRKCERVKIDIPAKLSYTLVSKSHTEFGTIHDLSQTGALISHKEMLQKGKRMILNFELGGRELINLQAVVQNIRQYLKSEEAYFSGVNFSSVSPENKATLEKFFENRRAPNGKKAQKDFAVATSPY